MDVNPYESPQEPDGTREGRNKSAKPDVINILATVGAPLYFIVRLITAGWTTAMFYVLVFGVVAAFYFWMFAPLSVESKE